MFMGEYNHTLDSKNRVIVPAKFREELGEQSVLTLGLDRCLYLYPVLEWERVAEQLDQLPGTQEARKMKRFFFSAATPCEIDKQGRILILPKHKNYAGLAKEIVFVGVSKKAEIWSRERYEDLSFDDMEEAADMISQYGISF